MNGQRLAIQYAPGRRDHYLVASIPGFVYGVHWRLSGRLVVLIGKFVSSCSGLRAYKAVVGLAKVSSSGCSP